MRRHARALWEQLRAVNHLGVGPVAKVCSYCKQTWPALRKCLKFPQTKAVLMFAGLLKPDGKKHELHQALHEKLVSATAAITATAFTTTATTSSSATTTATASSS